jgi:hypothetical protein
VAGLSGGVGLGYGTVGTMIKRPNRDGTDSLDGFGHFLISYTLTAGVILL